MKIKKQTNIAWSHLYVESKIVKFMITESRMVVTKGGVVGKIGRHQSKGTDFQWKDEYILET